MANEILLTVDMQLAKGFHRDQFALGQLKVDQSGVGGEKKVFNVSTTEGVLAFGEITTPGYAVFQSLEPDGGNFVTVGPEDTGAMVAMLRLNPGEVAVVRLDPSAIIRAQADTAAVPLLVWVIED